MRRKWIQRFEPNFCYRSLFLASFKKMLRRKLRNDSSRSFKRWKERAKFLLLSDFFAIDDLFLNLLIKILRRKLKNDGIDLCSLDPLKNAEKKNDGAR